MRYVCGAVLSAAAACAAPPPADVDLEIQIPDAWTAAETPPGALPQDWWTTFKDPRLERWVRESLQRNRNLRAAAARIEAAEAQARIAGADLMPAASAALNAGRRRQNFIGFPIPGGGVLSTTFTTYGVSLDLSWEVDLWGRLRSRAAAALADVQARQADYVGAGLSLIAQTAKTYFAAVEARRQADLARATADNRRDIVARIRERFTRGLRPAADLKLAEADLAEAEAVLRLRREQLDRASRQIEILAGRYPAATAEIEADLPDIPGPVPAGLPSQLLARRPDLVSAERALAASGARVEEAQAALYPQIRLTGSGGTSTDELSSVIDPDFRVWNVAAGLLAPIFQGGRLRAAADRARAEEAQALALYGDAVLRAFSEVETSLAAERFLAEREDALRDAAARSAEALQSARERYLSGLSDVLPMLEAERRHFAAESERIFVRRARLEARINLHLALGGGFSFDEELHR
ncbi:MAG: efflux transporter outer membrane subunit [Planctomycetes bacterium]|nr:efflux transporter outer membrane subunit [Planctomycetota bacterium]